MDMLTKGDSRSSTQNADGRVTVSAEPRTERGPGSSFRFAVEEEGDLSQDGLEITKRSRSVSRVPHFSRLLGLPRAAGALVAVGILLISIVAVRFIICLKGTAVGGKGSRQGIFSRGVSRRLADERPLSDDPRRPFSVGGLEECLADVGSTSDEEESGSLTRSSSAEAEDAGQGSGGPWEGLRPLLPTRLPELLRRRGFVSFVVFATGILMLVYSFSPALFVPCVAVLSATIGYLAGSAGEGPSGSDAEGKALERLVMSARFRAWCLSLLLSMGATYLLAPTMLPILGPAVTTALASSLWKGDLEDVEADGDSAAEGSEDSPASPEEGEGPSDPAAAAVRRRREPGP